MFIEEINIEPHITEHNKNIPECAEIVVVH